MPDIATISPLNPHPGYIGPPTVVWKDNFGTSRFHCHQSLGISEKIRYNVSAFFVTPPLPALSGVVASARFCCLSRVPPAVCPSLLESTTTVCTSFLQSLSTYVHTPTPHSILRFRPAPQTPDLHTSNLPHFCGLIWIGLRNSGNFGVGQVPGTSHVATRPKKHTCERRICPSLSRPFAPGPASSLFVVVQSVLDVIRIPGTRVAASSPVFPPHFLFFLSAGS